MPVDDERLTPVMTQSKELLTESPMDASSADGVFADEFARPLAAREILSSAVRAFAEHGFEGTTTRQICAGAGLSSAAIYVYFASKEDVLHQISVAGHQRVLARVRDAVGLGGSPTEVLSNAVRAFVLYHAEHHTMSRVITSELRSLSPEHLREVTEIRREIDAMFRAMITAGIAADHFACTDVHVAAVAIESLAIDLARWFDPRRDGWTPQLLAIKYADFALQIVKAQVSLEK